MFVCRRWNLSYLPFVSQINRLWRFEKWLECLKVLAVLGTAQEFVQLFLECLDVFEMSIDRGETDVCHFVQFAKSVHDMLTKCLCRDLFAHTSPFFFEFVEHCVYLVLGNRTLLAGLPYATLELFTVVAFAGVVFFDDNEICRLDTFKSGESVVALSAFASTTNLTLFVCFTRVEYSGVFVFAFRTKQLGIL